MEDYSQESVDDFYQNLNELIIMQARKLINHSLYTKALLSTLPVALIATDKEGLIKTLNHSAEEILGTKEKTIRESQLINIFGTESTVSKKINQSLSEGRPFHIRSENLTIALSNKNIVGNIYLQPIKDEENLVCGLLMTIEDLTYVHFLHDAFKRYVPPSVSELIAQNPETLKLGGEEKYLTVLFCDLVGFTSYSERYYPHEMVTIISDYFAAMTEEVFKFEGTLKEYVGDEMMVIFGAPFQQYDHAKRACLAALAMKKRLSLLRDEWSKIGRPPLRARTGVNSGEMLVGNLGSPYRFSYGVLGDNVNLASRLEGLNNMYGTEILIGQNTAKLVNDSFYLREIDRVRVKGRQQTVSVFELIESKSKTISQEIQTIIELYAEGLSEYMKQNWEKSIKFFKEAIECNPNDKPSSIMLERCINYKRKPPLENWDGVFQHTTK
ncbi:MAG: tetratricopeptide repeat protein [Desulfobacterales bacterium]|nr:tetratricopeptide repeat protein [Desulfobacterales bacterium]